MTCGKRKQGTHSSYYILSHGALYILITLSWAGFNSSDWQNHCPGSQTFNVQREWGGSQETGTIRTGLLREKWPHPSHPGLMSADRPANLPCVGRYPSPGCPASTVTYSQSSGLFQLD